VVGLVIFALVSAASAPPVAQANAPATVTAVPAQAAAQDNKVCRRDSEMGSIMRKRTCHTASEWGAIDKANNTAAQQALSDRRNPASQ
jgi:hypothetical protein